MMSHSLFPDFRCGTLTCFPWTNPFLLASWDRVLSSCGFSRRFLFPRHLVWQHVQFSSGLSETVMLCISFQNSSSGLELAAHSGRWGPFPHGLIMVPVRLYSLFYYVQQSKFPVYISCMHEFSGPRICNGLLPPILPTFFWTHFQLLDEVYEV
jgi:hypothetical protein